MAAADDYDALLRYLTHPPAVRVPPPWQAVWRAPDEDPPFGPPRIAPTGRIAASQLQLASTEQIEELLRRIGPLQRLVLALVALELRLPQWDALVARFGVNLDGLAICDALERTVDHLWQWVLAPADERGACTNELRPLRRQLEEALPVTQQTPWLEDRALIDVTRRVHSVVMLLLLETGADPAELFAADKRQFDHFAELLFDLGLLTPWWWQRVRDRLAFRDALIAELD